ncbi:hypothetical protein LUX12_05260 [Streptomyces somaliensis]|uniref:hypothetical protein n=1 Tax=Streptomyces somaliensis TaxID=78355 RepID=UPI0020CE8486|nr:hypothetical protein [Streptomyces somaliensis]MCP9944330.1 hypothetical protein [Streptomyces somaliensis]
MLVVDRVVRGGGRVEGRRAGQPYVDDVGGQSDRRAGDRRVGAEDDERHGARSGARARPARCPSPHSTR